MLLDEKLSVAPMMEMTDCHWRMLLRGITKKTVLYTEMVVDDTVIHNDDTGLDFFIGKNIDASPSVIQLGGHNPETLSQAAFLCERYNGGYDEINLVSRFSKISLTFRRSYIVSFICSPKYMY